MDKREEHHVELLEAREDAPEALEATKQALDLVATAIHGTIVIPGRDAVVLGRHRRDETEVERQLSRIVAFVGPIHQQVDRPSGGAKTVQQRSSLGRVVGIAGRQREGYRGSRVRRDEMDFGGPASARLSDRLRAVFFNAPVPSGCTLIEVLSSETASTLTRTI